MILSFKDAGMEAVFNGENSREGRRVCPQSLWRVAIRKLEQLDSVVMIDELRVPPRNLQQRNKGGKTRCRPKPILVLIANQRH